MDTLLEVLKNHILSLPQTFIGLLFVFSFLQPQPHKLYRRLAVFSLVHSLYTDLLMLFLPLYLHFINSQLTVIALLLILFKDLTFKQKIFIYLGSNLVIMSMDLIFLAVGTVVLGVSNWDNFTRDHLAQTICLLYPMLLIMLAASWCIRKRELFSIKKFFSYMMEGEGSSLTKALGFIWLQFILLGALAFIQLTSGPDKALITLIIIYLVIVASLLALFVILRLLVRTREQAVLATQEVYVEDIKDMFTSIRGQRHDFLNHVQVIHTMARMGKTEQLKSYVGDLVKETRDVTEIVHHSSPALAAFVQAKLTVALGKGIAFTYELPENWNVPNSSVRIFDIVKIMGNLVDNAFDESLLLPAEERRVHAAVHLQDNSMQLEVSNKGRALDAKEREQIFMSGYSTKGDGHTGLGLAIVMERIKHYRGEIAVECSKDNRMLFRVKLPLRETGVL